jgi:putative transposase
MGANPNISAHPITGAHTGAPQRAPARATIGNMVRWFKTMTTNEYIKNVTNNNWPPFIKRMWQRNYYEHIIRNNIALNNIRQYMQNNPKKWQDDNYYV